MTEQLETPTLPGTTARHILSLDGFRGCAVLLVILFHYLPRKGMGLLGVIASFGWTGVDAFLVLSAFLITSILYRQRGTEHFFRNFYLRRALRLFPLYYFILLITVALTPLLHIHWRIGHLPFFFYATNFALIKDQSLGTLGPLTFHHLWTLALEEQFYLLWPWLIGSRLSRETLLRVCWTGIPATLCLRIVLAHYHVNEWFLYESLPTRIDSLLVGALLALSPLPSVRAALIALLGAIAVLAGVIASAHTLWYASKPMMTFGYSALAVFYASLLVIALHRETWMARFLSLNVWRFYGRYSYGLYLWHYIFSAQIEDLARRISLSVSPAVVAGLLSFAIALLGSTAVAMCSYHLVEAPFLKLKHRYES